jgi:hypothetical protein
MKWLTQCGYKRKSVTMHDIGVEVESTDKATDRKTHDCKRQPACSAKVFRNKKLLGHPNTFSYTTGNYSEKQHPNEKQEMIFLDVQQKQLQGEKIDHSIALPAN